MTEPPSFTTRFTALGPWTVDSTRYVLRDRWLSVRADDCVTRDGVSIAPFYVLEYPDWVQVVAIDTDDQIVLVRQYRHGLGAISLELPAGGMEPTDAGPLEAAARELAEETGCVARSLRLVASLSPNPASHSNRVHVVLAEGVEWAQSPEQDLTERLDILRKPVSEVVRLAVAGEMVQAIHVASLAVALSSIDRWRG
jgi:8-oxo-dGTP pyrophosphatase MutT (NUDIX family)